MKVENVTEVEDAMFQFHKGAIRTKHAPNFERVNIVSIP